MFGHVKGSFTGAVRDRQGRFEAADGGTVFLDEIGEIPPPTQVKLLRFLQHKEFERVGETATSKVDVRVIAATNRDLQAAVGTGQFREDLYYRLNAVKVKLPPLRERQEDIPLLAQHFLNKLGAHAEVTPQVMAALSQYAWKGNVRELENVMERAVILARGETIQLYHLPEEFQALGTPDSPSAFSGRGGAAADHQSTQAGEGSGRGRRRSSASIRQRSIGNGRNSGCNIQSCRAFCTIP